MRQGISVEEIADRFVTARRVGSALADYPSAPPATLADAYCIQDAAISRVDDAIGGWKVGRIFPPQSVDFGADRLAGPIFARSIKDVSNGSQPTSPGRIFAAGFGAAEAEYLLRVGTPPALGQRQFSLAEAAAHIDAVHVGIEIASSPLPTINDLGPAVTASDFGNNNGLFVGPAIADWRNVDYTNWPVTLFIDDHAVGNGNAAGFPDGPMGSVRFLFELLAARRISLPSGSWISTGAITGVHPVRAGQRVEAVFAHTLRVGCQIEYVPFQSVNLPQTASGE